MEKLYKIHDGWGEDSLSKFQDAAINNEIWTHSQESNFNQILSECDALIYETLMKAAPKNKSEAGEGVLLFVNAHNHFRAAARLCLSGQFLPVYPTARASLETALYGWYLSTDDTLIEYWLNKPKIEEREKLKAWSKTFSFSPLANAIGKIEPRLKNILKETHQTSIDFGGHPNKMALYSNLVKTPDDNLELYTIGYIHQEGKIVYFTSNFLLDVALSILVMIKLTFPSIIKQNDFLGKYTLIATRARDFKNYAYSQMGWDSPPS